MMFEKQKKIGQKLAHVWQIWASVVVITVGLFVQFVGFDWACDISRASIGQTLLYDLLPALLVALLCTLARRKSVCVALTVVALLIMDAWMLSNRIYYGANGLFVTWQAAQLIGQLSGFESSLITFLSWRLLFYPVVSILLLVALAHAPYTSSWRRSLGLAGSVLCLYFGTVALRYHTKGGDAPFSAEWLRISRLPENAKSGIWAQEYDDIAYLNVHSIAGLFVKFCAEGLSTDEEVELTAEDDVAIRRLIGQQAEGVSPQGPLVFILVESMEGWVVEAETPDGTAVCPNLRLWLDRHPSIYSSEVWSQKMYGESGDGQLICMTGLLPIDDGVACNQYGTNTFPNWAHFYPQSTLINPCTYLWNQDVVTYSYGFKTLLEPEKESAWWNDSIVFAKTRETLVAADTTCCVLAITVDSHQPFSVQGERLNMPDELPEVERDYINCFHHVDSVMGVFLAWADTARLMQNATIVITGDHYASYEGIGDRPRYKCPLIISSPSVKRNIHPGEMYQMDIFPTLLDAIGEPYYWHGFGLSALRYADQCPWKDSLRTYSADEARRLSNLIIRTDRFASVQQ